MIEQKKTKFIIYLINPYTIFIFLAFFIAKVWGGLEWNWIWVFSPLWIPTAFILFLYILIGILTLIQHILWKY